MKKQLGFTLIELMVVMAIIAILATAGLSAYTSYIKKANDSKNITMLSELNSITEMFRDGKGELPAGVEDMVTRYYNSRGAVADNHKIPSLAWAQDIFGVSSAFAIPNASDYTKILVAGGDTGCAYWNGTKIAYNGPCAVYFLKFSDGTYVWGVGVRTETALLNSFQLDNNGADYAPAETSNVAITPLVVFKGNNKALGTVNSSGITGTPIKVSNALSTAQGMGTPPTFTISIKSNINQSSVPQNPSTTTNLSSTTTPPTTTTNSDPCAGISIGSACTGTAALYLGTYGGSKYMSPVGDVGGSMTWSTAMSACDNLVFGGYSDWYLPTSDELRSLLWIDGSSYSTRTKFVSNGFGEYWSSTDYGGGYKNEVYFMYGTISAIHDYQSVLAHCVRKY